MSPVMVRRVIDRERGFSMKSLDPILTVKDMRETLRFYNDVLGFETVVTMPDANGDLMHASVRRGNVNLMFGPRQNGGLPPAGDGIVLYFTLDDDDDVDAEFAHAKSRGATVVQEPTDQFWGHRDWTIEDPDGYHLSISKMVREVSMDELAAAGMAAATAD
jgi:PhnB protein